MKHFSLGFFAFSFIMHMAYAAPENYERNVPTLSATIESSLRVYDNGRTTSACLGGQVRLRATVTPTNTQARFVWTGPNGYSSTEQNPVLANLQEAHMGVYRITVTLPDWNNLTLSDIVIVNQAGNRVKIEPVSMAGVSKPKGYSYPDFCEGESVMLKTSLLIETDATYSWTGPDGFTSKEKAPVITAFTKKNEGAYSVTVTASGVCPGVITDDEEVRVRTSVANIDAYSISRQKRTWNFCPGDSMQLLSNLNVNQPATYQWTGPNGFVSNEANPVLPRMTRQSEGGYSLRVDVSGFCAGRYQYNFQIEMPDSSMYAYGLAKDRQWWDGGGSLFCPGEAFRLEARYSGSLGRTAFRWSGPNGFTSSEEKPLIPAATPTTTGVYSVTATPLDGCYGPAVAKVNIRAGQPKLTLDIYPERDMYHPYITPDTMLCVGETTRLGAFYSESDIHAGNIHFAYRWQGPGGFTSTDAQPRFNATTSGVYSVTATYSGACEGVITLSRAATVGLPKLTIMSDSTFCVGDSIRLRVQGTHLTRWDFDTPAFTWRGPNGFSAKGSAVSVLSSNVAQAGAYQVTATYASYCNNAVINATTNVTLRQPATVTYPRDTAVARGATFALPLRLGGDGPWRVTLWDGTAQTIAISPLVVQVRADSTTRYVVRAVANGCGPATLPAQPFTLTVLQVLGIGVETALKLYPNPAQTAVTIEWPEFATTPVRLTLYDAAGRPVRQRSTTPLPGQTAIYWPVADLPGGMYRLHLASDHATFSRLLMKQ